MYFQLGDNQVLSTRGQPDVFNLHTALPRCSGGGASSLSECSEKKQPGFKSKSRISFVSTLVVGCDDFFLKNQTRVSTSRRSSLRRRPTVARGTAIGGPPGPALAVRGHLHLLHLHLLCMLLLHLFLPLLLLLLVEVHVGSVGHGVQRL